MATLATFPVGFGGESKEAQLAPLQLHGGASCRAVLGEEGHGAMAELLPSLGTGSPLPTYAKAKMEPHILN